ncbi:MAG: DUF4845 domain-containing protein [Candidatus Methylumidiphilus sp.]
MKSMTNRQNGMTLISFLAVFVVAGFLVLLTLKLVPVYLDHMKVKSSLEGLKTEAGLADKPAQEIRKMLQKRWDINSIQDLSAEESVFIEKKSGVVKIQVAYEVEKPVMGNMSALIKFEDSITVGDTN